MKFMDAQNNHSANQPRQGKDNGRGVWNVGIGYRNGKGQDGSGGVKLSQEELLRQLQELENKSISGASSEPNYSEFGKDILMDLENQEKKEYAVNRVSQDDQIFNFHKNVQNKFEKRFKATEMVNKYIERKNNKNLLKEELKSEYASVTDNQSLNQSQILKKSIFDDFEEDFKKELLHLKSIKNPILGRNQLGEIRQRVEEEMKVYKENNPEIFNSDLLEKRELDFKRGSPRKIKNRSFVADQGEHGDGGNDIDAQSAQLMMDDSVSQVLSEEEINELNKSIEKDRKVKQKQIEKDKEFLAIQRERMLMAEEVSLPLEWGN